MDESPKPVRILLIEDHPDIASAFVGMLALAQFPAIAVLAPLQIGQLLCEGGPELVLIDLMLNGGPSGIELARDLRERYPDLRLIAMSASSLMLDQAQQSGLFCAVLDKTVGDVVSTCYRLLNEESES